MAGNQEGGRSTLVALLVIFASVAACAATPDPTVAANAFAECMRSEGIVEYPAQPIDEEGRIDFTGVAQQLELLGIDAESGEFRNATDKCSSHLTGVELYDEAAFDRLEEAVTNFASCMREEGVDVPTPDLTNLTGVQDAPRTVDRLFGGSANDAIFADTELDLSDPSVVAALEECGFIVGVDSLLEE